MASQRDRIRALAAELGYPQSAYEAAAWGEHTFTDGGAEYLVLTDEEADAAAAEYVAESLWAFRAAFLAELTGLPEIVFSRLSDLCEGANEAFRALVDQTCGLDELVSEAIAADGRGHFLASYDGNELELGSDLYAYRTN